MGAQNGLPGLKDKWAKTCGPLAPFVFEPHPLGLQGVEWQVPCRERALQAPNGTFEVGGLDTVKDRRDDELEPHFRDVLTFCVFDVRICIRMSGM